MARLSPTMMSIILSTIQNLVLFWNKCLPSCVAGGFLEALWSVWYRQDCRVLKQSIIKIIILVKHQEIHSGEEGKSRGWGGSWGKEWSRNNVCIPGPVAASWFAIALLSHILLCVVNIHAYEWTVEMRRQSFQFLSQRMKPKCILYACRAWASSGKEKFSRSGALRVGCGVGRVRNSKEQCWHGMAVLNARKSLLNEEFKAQEFWWDFLVPCFCN